MRLNSIEGKQMLVCFYGNMTLIYFPNYIQLGLLQYCKLFYFISVLLFILIVMDFMSHSRSLTSIPSDPTINNSLGPNLSLVLQDQFCRYQLLFQLFNFTLVFVFVLFLFYLFSFCCGLVLFQVLNLSFCYLYSAFGQLYACIHKNPF